MSLRIQPVGAAPLNASFSAGSRALDLEASGDVLLRFAIEASGDREIEALRNARRSMLKEEWTLGRDGQEPSLEQAVFSSAEIRWRVAPPQRPWCLQKIQDLLARANRSLVGS